MAGETPTSILHRLFDVGDAQLSPAAAEAVIQLKFRDSDQARLGELAVRSTAGILTPDEAAEYDAYLAAADLLSIWKSKARLTLQRHPTAA